MKIKKAIPADIPLIRDLTFRIWPQTYRSILTEEQIDYMLELMYNERTLEEQMQQGHQFILLYEEALPLGFASYSDMEQGIYKLHKIYVLPSEQGKGAGRFIIDYIIAEIKSKGATALRLNVNRHNKAKDFYEKIGFKIIYEEDIDIGQGFFMNDFVMSYDMNYEL